MKKNILFFVLTIATISLSAQSLVGAWEASFTTSEGIAVRNVVIFSKSFMASSFFGAEDGAFMSVNGGSWKFDGTSLTGNIEFDTRNPDSVGSEMQFNLKFSGKDELSVEGVEMTWKRLDDGTPGDLDGAWLMSGRKQNGEIQSRSTDRPRKTMKILSGTRFQWIAYNTETKQFMGTGGGNYTTVNGKYTENIEFFSRDNSRVGASLKFDYKLEDGNNWHHSGFSSKGDPLYEIWSQRKK